ncbi:hypothetical protein Tco_0663952 [Tanacetum coccineum]
MQTTHVAEETATMPHDSPLPRVHTLRSDEGSLTLNELIVLCTTLSKKVESLESDLKQTKLTYGAAYTKLIMRGRTSTNTEILLDQEEPTELVEDLGSGEKGEKEISTANVPVSTARAIPKVSTTGPSSSTAEHDPPVKIKRSDQGDLQLQADAELAQLLKRAGEKQSEESTKRKKLEDVAEKEELKTYLKIDHDEDRAVNYEALATKYLIVDWESQIIESDLQENDLSYWKITRVDDSSKFYKVFSMMLKDFDRQDLVYLHRLIMERFSSRTLEGYDLILWGDFKTMFEPIEEDDVWRNQQDWSLISWKLYESCGVHAFLMDGILLEAEAESTMAFELLKFIKSQPDTAYRLHPIRRISDESALAVEIDLTWSLRFGSVEMGRLLIPLSSRISLIMFEFSSCILADSAINLVNDSSVVCLRSGYEEFMLFRW